jgi:CheY-like chemotaxis protein
MPHTFDFLVADDDADTRALMEIFLTSLGHRVTLAANGQEVLAWLHTRGLHVDMVVIDVQMPGMDGLEATRRLREHPATRALPVLCISAKAGRATEAQCHASGCDAFLTKPCWEEDILAAMSSVLRARGRLAAGEAL